MTSSVSTSTVDRFREALTRNAATVRGPLPALDLAKTMVATAMEAGRGGPVAVPSADGDPVLASLGVLDALVATGVEVVSPDHPDWRASMARTPVGVTGCVAASAAPGAVALRCGPGAPRAVSLAPDLHICVVPVSLVEPTLGLALERALAGASRPNLVWVSGPSRSADIEKRITLGVHGPRTLEVVLVDA